MSAPQSLQTNDSTAVEGSQSMQTVGACGAERHTGLAGSHQAQRVNPLMSWALFLR